jgi:CO/xanthine dehydrogenase Mo-binding subunit
LLSHGDLAEIGAPQCRGQIEGGIAQALGAALYEEVRIDDGGSVTTHILRQRHIPTFADVPRSEVYFARTGWARSAPRHHSLG